jgi:hypothetical protein
MTGVTVRRDMTEGIAATLRGVGGDVAEHYAKQLGSGEVVPVIELSGPEKVWAPGELFLRS